MYYSKTNLTCACFVCSFNSYDGTALVDLNQMELLETTVARRRVQSVTTTETPFATMASAFASRALPRLEGGVTKVRVSVYVTTIGIKMETI